MYQTAVDFVSSKWALLTAEGKTILLVGVAIGFVAGLIIG